MPKRDFAKLLKTLRDKLSLSQAEMAEKLGISQAYVAQIENKAVDLDHSGKVAEKILEVLSESPVKEKDVDFGEWLLEQRTKRGLSRQELAEKAGVSYLGIYFIETGRTESPQKRTIEALEKVLGKLPRDVQEEVTESAEGGFGEYQGPFSIEEWKSSVDETTPGIYVFYDVLKRPVYVGQSGDIRKRISEHSDAFWFKSPLVHTISYIVVKEEKLRRQLEAAIIKIVGENAIFNQQHKI